MSVNVHPTAVVHPGAQLGANVTVGPYAVIEDKTFLGEGATIDAFANIKAYVRLGAGARVHSYACVGGEPQDLKFKGQESWVRIGDRTVIREYVTVHRGSEEAGSETVIGADCLIMSYAHVAHDCVIGDQVILANSVALAGHVRLGRKVTIGGLTGLHQFVNVGDYAFVGAMSGISQDVPPYTLTSGVRGPLHGLNLIGLRRSGFSNQTISALKKAYVTIFRSGLERQQALDEALDAGGGIPEVRVFVEFIRSSKRGVVADAGNGDGENGQAG